MIILPSDCKIGDDGLCTRTDGDHGWATEDVYVAHLAAPVDRIRSHCYHLPAHVVPVKSSVTGEVVTHLCLTCDEQVTP